MVDRAGAGTLARHHPLTVEGEDIGSFDLVVACGAGSESYDVSYVERRHSGDHAPVPAKLGAVTVRVANTRRCSRWLPPSAAASRTNSSPTPPERCRPR